ncbi:hypothetical protein FOZ61_007156 [Perkinsus olseni]|uniref:Uncharacterized protein n=1 Tax=Perkinsus olseni TaxID=32597 RepID=A0A7J6LA94_PEROL|nr:hypothetical protein FOZ61_007156 [Perkinsus olseni]
MVTSHVPGRVARGLRRAGRIESSSVNNKRRPPVWFRYTLPDLRNCDRPQNLRSWDERASVGVQVCENELEGCVEIDLRPTVRDLPSIVEDVGK